MEIIPVFFTFNKYYVIAAEVAIYSLLKHASHKYEYRLYVLHTDLTTSMQKEVVRVVRKFKNASLEFIDTSSFDKAKNILESKSHFSKEIYYKLIAAEIFPQYDRIICSDVDVVFEGDISDSYFMFPDEFFYFAGVGQFLESVRMDIYKKDFTEQEREILKKEISAGYMLMNLKAIRENNFQKKLTDYYIANYHRLYLPEQDCIILCCWPYIKYLPIEYFLCNNYYKENPEAITLYQGNEYVPKDRDTAISIFKNALKNPIQVHYVGADKPWNSFFVPKQKNWFSMLYESGCTFNYLEALPIIIFKKLQQYSLKRFIKKCHNRLTGKNNRRTNIALPKSHE